jgi:hypothetical protein
MKNNKNRFTRTPSFGPQCVTALSVVTTGAGTVPKLDYFSFCYQLFARGVAELNGHFVPLRWAWDRMSQKSSSATGIGMPFS